MHIRSGTHSVPPFIGLRGHSRRRRPVFDCLAVLGRPEVVAARPSQHAGRWAARTSNAAARCSRHRAACYRSGDEPVSAAVIKIANNFVLGCAIEALGEGFALIRKYGVAPDVFLRRADRRLVQLPGLQDLRHVHRREKYLPAGQRAVNGLKDANLALAAGEAVGVPFPAVTSGGTVWSAPSPTAKANTTGQ